MSLIGNIIAIKDNTAIVKVKPVANCNGCKTCALLLKNNSSFNEEREIEATLKGDEYQVGDKVKLELSEGRGSTAALILYGIPIIAFMTGLLLSSSICEFLSIPISDLAQAITAFIFLTISFLIVYFILRRTSSSRHFLMTITEKV